jgi:hypothetical protein
MDISEAPQRRYCAAPDEISGAALFLQASSPGTFSISTAASRPADICRFRRSATNNRGSLFLLWDHRIYLQVSVIPTDINIP